MLHIHFILQLVLNGGLMKIITDNTVWCPNSGRFSLKIVFVLYNFWHSLLGTSSAGRNKVNLSKRL